MSLRVWAPEARRVDVVLPQSGQRRALRAAGRGVFEDDRPLAEGTDYALSLDGGDPLPDPRSPYQPNGVHAPSRHVRVPLSGWEPKPFAPAPLSEALIYELHVGTFSEPGTFEGVVSKLPHLKRLGVTHVELMPVAAFPGRWGWGYDGVDLFAPHEAYGGPLGLRRLVDACHAQGVAVLFDVVYNHLGPSGNYLSKFGPYFTRKYSTPWGEALNFDGPGADEVRGFVCDNAIHWLEDYGIDGLRLDALHAIYDQSALHVIEQLTNEVAALAERRGRRFQLIGESALNDPRFVRQPEDGGYGLSSQWNDDFHHALRSLLTGDTSGYYSDFGKLSQLARALSSGFVYQGEYSEHRGHAYGREPLGLDGTQFVVFSQNHDQVGNRAIGDRLTRSVSQGRLKIAAALTLLSPFVPMLFMGEEWAASTPFLYFTDHEEADLADAVRKGRRREFASFGWEAEEIPDPQKESTFLASKLDWSEPPREPHRAMLDWYTRLSALRREQASLREVRLEQCQVSFDEDAQWLAMRRGSVCVACNLAPAAVELPLAQLSFAEDGRAAMLLASEDDVGLSSARLLLPSDSVAVLELDD